MKNPTAAILIIGNEILSGRTQDANTQFLAQQLDKLGIDVIEARTVRDEVEKIISTVQELASTYTYVFTTGGIGATHDDITAACMARAFNRPLIQHPEIVQFLTGLADYYQTNLNEAYLRMALVPEGAAPIHNLLNSAPGFQIENVFCLAGIPSVMQSSFGTLIPRLNKGKPIYQQSLTGTITESVIADDLAYIQACYPEVEIGSYPFFHSAGDYGVVLVLRTRNQEILGQAFERVKEMIQKYGVVPQIQNS